MTALQAIQILDQATANLNAPRNVHAQIAEALRVLAALIQATEPATSTLEDRCK